MSNLKKAEKEIFEWCKNRPYVHKLVLITPYSQLNNDKTKIRFLLQLFVQHGYQNKKIVSKNNQLTYCRWFLEHIGNILVKNKVYQIELCCEDDILCEYILALKKWAIHPKF